MRGRSSDAAATPHEMNLLIIDYVMCVDAGLIEHSASSWAAFVQGYLALAVDGPSSFLAPNLPSSAG